MSVEYVGVDCTLWPVDHETDDEDATQWRLRYGNPTRTDYLGAAAVMAAYAHLLDPNITQTDAINALKRARKASVKSRIQENQP
jgi:hypothetical protein